MAETVRVRARIIRQGKNVDRTIAEKELDTSSQDFGHSLRSEGLDVENDLAVDGLSESLMSRLFSLFMFRSN